MTFLQEYEKIRMIGKGAFASVFKVRHAKLGYVRALKVCDSFIEDENDRAWQTFLSECKVLLRIGNGSHPNIVKIFLPRLIDNHAVVEMDCVEGDSLHSYIKQNLFIPIEEFYRFAKQIIGALAYCHVDVYKFLMNPLEDKLEIDPNDGRKYIVSPEKEKELIKKYGVVHNDLHSGNIIRRDYDGQYILLDFGLAIQDSHCVKSSSRFDGAIEYCSPEKLENGTISTQSDVYALGILLYEVLTGRVPFPYSNGDGSTPESARSRVYQQHLHETPPPVFEFRKQAFEATHPGETYTQDYPEQLEAIIMKCLAKKPEERFKNAKELLNVLERALDSFDPIKKLEETNVKLSNQLDLVYQRINDIEEGKIKIQSTLEEERKKYNDLQRDTARHVNYWKKCAIIFPIVIGIALFATAFIIGKNISTSNVYNTSHANRVLLTDTVFSKDGNTQIIRETVRDTVIINHRDTVKIEVPRTITSTQTKVEYRTSPEIQNELKRLKAENSKNTAEVNRLKSQIQEKDRHIKALKDELFK